MDAPHGRLWKWVFCLLTRDGESCTRTPWPNWRPGRENTRVSERESPLVMLTFTNPNTRDLPFHTLNCECGATALRQRRWIAPQPAKLRKERSQKNRTGENKRRGEASEQLYFHYTDEIALLKVFSHGELVLSRSPPLKDNIRVRFRWQIKMSQINLPLEWSQLVGLNFLASHQLSSRQIDRRQQEDRVQPRVGLHLPPFLLHLHEKRAACVKRAFQRHPRIHTGTFCRGLEISPQWFCQRWHLRPHRWTCNFK